MLDRNFKPGEAVSPVTGWAMMPLVEHDSLLLRLDFLTDPSPAAAARNGRGRVYAVTSEQLQQLLNSLQAQLDKLQPVAAGPRH
ncbi:hypothetical protein ABFG95_07835 [Achromobacter sp. HNDS-1]|uniref:Uncharacterized protein n=1 Tax=Achromobacter sp. HNDS-1 TaxID=3151598 RepID=A0AAU7LEN4_9BURK|nr:hypothetical protein [Achromobacter ruhlandii]MCI1839662.1 hypothetical protein [Achromobacter ruhlandii]